MNHFNRVIDICDGAYVQVTSRSQKYAGMIGTVIGINLYKYSGQGFWFLYTVKFSDSLSGQFTASQIKVINNGGIE